MINLLRKIKRFQIIGIN